MSKKFIISVVTILVVILALFALYYIEETPDEVLKSVELDVYSGSPVELSDIIADVETGSYYEGYDNDTLNWMKSLGDKYVLNGNGTFVVMDFNDVNKLPNEDVTDVIIINHIRCDVLETHSLGNVEYPRDIQLVKNVEYLGQEIIDLGLA